MTDPQRKLTVRVKLAPEPGPEVTGTPQYAYRWDRIALAALALVVVVALVFRALLTPDQAPAEGAGDPGTRTIAASAPKPAPAAADPEPEPITQTEAPTAPVLADTEPPGAPAPLPERSPTTQTDTAVAAAPAAVLPAEPPAAQAPVAGSAAAARRSQGADEPPPAAPPVRDGGLLAAGATRILSDHVTRFVLTDEVRNLEPVGGLTDIRARPPGGPLAVFAFSDVRGLGGETLYYRWIRDENVAANVKVRVGSDRWRSYSSKFITGAMRGPWRVELRNSAGELLAQAEFQY